MSLVVAEHVTVSETLGPEGVSATSCMVGSVFCMVVVVVVVSCPPYPSWAVMVHVRTSPTETIVESRVMESPVSISCPPTDHV